ncbi:CinA family protein [Paracoccus marcusii]|nr:CinA family protein [Paracoccus marcusii]
MQMLGVRAETLDTHGAVSEQVAAEMAQGALRQSDAGIAVSVTGIAGPGDLSTSPKGGSAGISQPFGTFTQTVEFGAIGRHRVRAATIEHALQLLLDALRN